jgi:hypothetical protein
VGNLTFFASIAIGLIAVSRRIAKDSRWHDLAGYTLAAGVVAVLAFPVMSILVQPAGAPLHPWFGVAQRVLVVAVLFPPLIALAIRLWRTSGAAPGPTGPHGRRRSG